MDMVQKALQYAQFGWRIFPCSQDKRPLIKEWQLKATHDPDQLKEWWEKWPDANIGMATGPGSGVWALDVDLPEGPINLGKIQQDKDEPISEKLWQKTGSGGMQIFFAWNGRNIRNTASKIATGIDTRGDGGYVILPPSIHPNGKRYEWQQKSTPDKAPEWLLDMLESPAFKNEQSASKSCLKSSEYGRKAMASEISDLSSASEGTRNNQLNTSAFRLGQLIGGGELDESQVKTTLFGVALGLGLEEVQSRKTIDSGISKGKLSPRTRQESSFFGSDESGCKQMKADESDCKPSKAEESGLKAECEQNNMLTVPQLIEKWVKENTGFFTTNQVDMEFNLKTRVEKNNRAVILNRLKSRGLIRKDGTKTGHWRIVSKDTESMDIFSTAVQKVKLPLCLGLSELVNVYPGSIIVIAGSSNAGKSAFAMNIVFGTLAYVSALREIYNINSIPAFVSGQGRKPPETYAEYLSQFMGDGKQEVEVNYFNSEMAAPELKDRLDQFPGGAETFRKVRFWKRSSDFADAIRPNDINVIDYMECYDEFWKIGQWINEIHKELNKGIAIIVLQKKQGAYVGRGGELTMEKPRLYINLDGNHPHGGICKIIKAKSFTDPQNNPNGKEIDFKLVDGWKFVPISGLRYVDEKEREKINKEYSRGYNA